MSYLDGTAIGAFGQAQGTHTCVSGWNWLHANQKDWWALRSLPAVSMALRPPPSRTISISPNTTRSPASSAVRRRSCRKRNRSALRCDDAEHLLLDLQAGVDVSDREDGPVVITAGEWIEGVRATDATVLSHNGGVRVSGLPLAPRRRDHRGLIEHDAGFAQRAGERRAENVSKTEPVTRSYITLLERDSRPDVRRRAWRHHQEHRSVKNACAEPHSVQYGIPIRLPPSVSFTISWISMMCFG